MPKPPSPPSYQLHKASGQARTVVDGKSIYLGKFNSPGSQEKFNDIVAEWRLRHNIDQYSLTIDDLCIKFTMYADQYYRSKDGSPTLTAENFRHALRPLVKLFGRQRVGTVGPKKLKAVREDLIAAGLSRTYINGVVSKIKQVFRWGVEEEIVPPQVYEALKSLSWLRAGRSGARETAPVLPVGEGTVSSTVRHLSRVVGDMVRLQLLCGARPGEVCSMRPADVTRGTSGVWTYRPRSHKTEHRGRGRRIFIGPEGQRILGPYLERDGDAFCFSPRESESRRNADRRSTRESPLTPSQAARWTNGRQIQPRYSQRSYNRAIQRACEAAFDMPVELRYVLRTVARVKNVDEAGKALLKERLNREAAEWRAMHCWSPNQLRHSRATEIRERFGREAAATVLGHADPKTTEIYAERDFAMAERIMSEVG